MSSIINPNDSPIQQPYDKYWDSPPTRRELQKAFNKIGNNDADLMLMVDNLNLVCNCLCEKLNVTRGELDIYVAKKAAELNAMHNSQAGGETNAQSNS
jgi:hypothetical protein